MNNDMKLAAVQKQVAEEKGFYAHLVKYTIVVCALAIFNYYTGGYFWVKWVAFGWGIGLTSHALGVFGYRLPFFKGWEERRTEQLMKDQ